MTKIKALILDLRKFVFDASFTRTFESLAKHSNTAILQMPIVRLSARYIVMIFISTYPNLFGQVDNLGSGYFKGSSQPKNVADRESAIPAYQKAKIPFYGNSTTYGVQTILSKDIFLGVNLGRTYGKIISSGAFGGWISHTIGLSYDFCLTRPGSNLYAIFYQYDALTNILVPVSVKLDILTNREFSSMYVRPNIGVSVHLNRDFKLDFLYGYMFNSDFSKNSFSLRVNYIPNLEQKWSHINLK